MTSTYAHPLIHSSALTSPEPDEEWWWTANHVNEYVTVTGGRSEVRMFVRAIDGDDWPFTVAGSFERDAWFQVLGTSEACVFEIGGSWGVAMVAHPHRAGRNLIPLPPECQYWVPRARPSELFTAEEAFALGVRHVHGVSLPSGYERRPVYNPGSGSGSGRK